MIKHICFLVFLFFISGFLNAQKQAIEFGLGTKYDFFTIKQPENVFERNLDLGAIAFVSYCRTINDKLDWEAGLATNNYKLNFKVKGPEGELFSTRELVSVMRSNRIFLNICHKTKTLNKKLFWVNTFGISLLFGAKNPYDVILQRSKEIETTGGTKSVEIKIKTFGLTGSAILIGVGSKLYYQMNSAIKLFTNLGFITGTGELSKVEVDYTFGTDYKKAIFSTNGFAPMFTFGLQYSWDK